MDYRRRFALGLDVPNMDRVAEHWRQVALEILDRPWRPEASSAQPPIVCGHERTQDVRNRRGFGQIEICAVCGYEPGLEQYRAR